MQPTPRQRQARMDNFCIRSMLGLSYSLRKAGHNYFAERIDILLHDLRQALTKERQRNGPK